MESASEESTSVKNNQENTVPNHASRLPVSSKKSVTVNGKGKKRGGIKESTKPLTIVNKS